MLSMGRMKVLLVMAVCLILLGHLPLRTNAVRLSDFSPFGPDFDEALPTGNDPSVTVILNQPIPYFGQIRDRITVENDGVLELQSASSSSAFIYAFSADVDTTGIGQVFYRETTDPSLLYSANKELEYVFPDLGTIDLTSLFIATWFYVGYFDNNVDRTNTFQCIIGTDGSLSFVGLLYADGMIEWMTGDADGGVNGLGGDRADVGFVSDVPSNSFFLPVSNTSAVLMLDSMSNVDADGLWFYRIDQDMVIQPTDTIPLPGSGSASGSGNGLFGASCVEAGFTTCCVGNSSVCTVGPSPIECSCSQDCFSQSDSCCHDITVVPCFPEITIGFTSTSVLIQEGGTAQVGITAFGFPDNPLSFRVPVEAYILVYTSDNTAEAPTDYEGIVRVLEFSSNGTQMVDINIPDDSLPEDVESFFVTISTSDDYVTVLTDSAQVIIQDNEGTFMVAFSESTYISEESSGEVEVCVEALSPPSQLSSVVTVLVIPQSGSATDTAPVDFTSSSIAVSFSSSSPLEICVQIPLENDAIFEEVELFSVSLVNQLGTLPTVPSSASVIILDDDNIIVGFNDSNYLTVEGQNAEVCMQVFSGELETTAFFSITVTLVSASSSDLDEGPYILPIFAGTDSNCIEIPTFEDTVAEGNELFVVDAEAQGQDTSRIFLSVASALVTIEDNDESVPQAVISLQFATYTALESDAVVEVCVSVGDGDLSSLSAAMYRIQTTDRSAIGGSDYGSLDLDVNITTTSSMMCFPIELTLDSVIENRERFDVLLSSDDPSLVVDRDQSMVFIDDSTTVTIRFMPTLYTVPESDLFEEVCVTVPDSVQLDRSISYSVQTVDDSAIAGLDYDNTSEVVTVSSTPSQMCTQIPILVDSVVENMEQFFAILSSNDEAVQVRAASQVATISIVDDSEVQVSFATSGYLVNEGDNTVEVCLVLTGQLERSVNVTISTVSNTATAPDDYESFSGLPVVFDTAPSQQCVDVVIVEDSIIESNEVFEIELDVPQNDSAVSIGATDRSMIIIIDNDVVSCGIALTSNAYSNLESEGMVEVCLMVFGQGSVDVSVQLETVAGSGTATAGVDYQPYSETVTFSSVNLECRDVMIFDDNTEESDETFQVQISDSVCQLSQTMATVTIIDDDEFNLLSLSQDTYTVVESQGQVEVCVQSLIPVVTDATATILTLPQAQSAVDGEDYEGGTFTLVLLAGESQFCLNITIIDDQISEVTQVFSVFLSNNNPGVDSSAAMATVVIVDDDDVPVAVSFELEVVDETEGQSNVELCVVTSATPAPGQSVPVLVQTVDDSAVGGEDYTPLTNEVLTFTSTSPQRQCVDIGIIDDDVIEPLEQFFVQLNGDATTQAVVTIADNSEITIQFMPSMYTVTEGDDPFVEVCVSIPGSVQLERSISYSVMTADGSALGGIDYTVATEDLTVSSTPFQDCTPITIVGDAIVENTEILFVLLNSNDPAVNLGNPAAVEILDSSEASVSFVQSTITIDESVGSVEVCLLLTGVLDRMVTVTISTVPDTATAPGDYESFSGLPVVFDTAPSQQCVDVVIINDNIIEPNEVFEVELDVPQNDSAVSLVSIDRTMIVITDDDTASCGIGLTSTTYSAVEGSGSVTVCLLKFSQSSEDVSVQLETVTGSGTAIADVDYQPFSETVTFSSASSSNMECRDVMIIDDNMEESDETFQVQIRDSVCQLSQTTATVTIVDDDEFNLLSLTQDMYTVVESQGQVEVCIESLIPVVTDATATILTLPQAQSAVDGEDYEGGTFTLVLLAGESQFCLNITIIDNQIVEGIETFLVFLSNNNPGVDSSAATATVVIVDDDDIQDIPIVFEQDVYVVNEDGVNQEVCVVPNSTLTDGQTISGVLSTVDDSAVAGEDYVALTGVAISFTSTSLQRQCVDIGIINNPAVEPTEQFFVQIDQGTSSTRTSVLITDDDFVSVTFEQANYGAIEGQLGVEVCVVTDVVPEIGNDITVQISTQDGTATAGSDYIPVDNLALTFTSTSLQRQCVNIEILDDQAVESAEQFTVEFTQLTLQGPISNQATVLITDDDVEEVITISFEFTNYNVVEGVPSVMVCAITSATPAPTESISAQVSTQDGSAIAGSDYIAVNNQVLTFTSTSLQRQCINIGIIDDALIEPNEQFFVQLSQDATQDINQAVITIIDNDVPVEDCTLSLFGAATVSEDSSFVSICVQLEGSTTNDVFVNYNTAPLTATADVDYESVSTVITFPPTTLLAVQCPQIIIIDDSFSELDETFEVEISSASCQVTQNTFTVTIEDDDGNAGPILRLSQAFYPVMESSPSVEICVQSSALLLESATATVSTSDGTALGGQDYVGGSMTVTIPINDNEACATYSIIDDGIVEDTELFNVALTSSDLAVDPLSSSAVVTITDNDGGALTVTLEQAQYFFNEDTDPDLVMVCVDLMESTLNREVDIQLTLREGSALSNVDFVQETATIRFDPMNLEPIICERIELINDIFFEDTEQFFVDLSTLDPIVTFDIQTASIIIINDDSLVAEAQFINVDNFIFREGNLPIQLPLLNDICIEVVPSGYPGNVQVLVSTDDGSAIRGSDYDGVSQVLTLPPGIDELCTSFISIIGDSVIEPTETFLVSLTAVNTDITVGGAATVTILDDDQVNESIVLINDTPDVTVDSTAGTATIRVDFTLRNDVVQAECSLGPDFPIIDCTNRTVLFTDIPADTRESLPFLVRAFNQLGEEVGNVTRNVRIGFNNDCSVVFVNMGEGNVFVFGQGSVLINWELVGPVEFTECRLETRVDGGDDIIGEYSMCDSPHEVQSLAPGNYGVKVRPSGVNCERRIRRTIDFTVQ